MKEISHKRNSFITRKSYEFFILASVCNVLICGIVAIFLPLFTDETVESYTKDPVLNRYVGEYMPWIGFIALTFGMREVILSLE